MTDTATETKTPAKATGPTGYIVLSCSADSKNWHQVGKNVLASSAEQAIRRYVDKSESKITDPITLVAIPARSWKPVTVTAKVTTTLVLEDAK